MADNKTAVERGNKAAERRERERKKDMKAGSVAPEKSLRSVRGCKAGQMSGKNFSGTY